MTGRAGAALRDDRGSAPVEFVLVGLLLTFLTLAVLQLALALHIRNTALDAADHDGEVLGRDGTDGTVHAGRAQPRP